MPKAVNHSGFCEYTTAHSVIRSQDPAHCSQACYARPLCLAVCNWITFFCCWLSPSMLWHWWLGDRKAHTSNLHWFLGRPMQTHPKQAS